jgi:hypothetical protein
MAAYRPGRVQGNYEGVEMSIAIDQEGYTESGAGAAGAGVGGTTGTGTGTSTSTSSSSSTGGGAVGDSGKKHNLPIDEGKRPGSVNVVGFNVLLAATGVDQQLPAYPVGHTGVVRLKATNGTLAGNADVITVGLYRGGQQYTLDPFDEVEFPVDTLAQVWVKGTAADGVQATVKARI